MKARSFDCLLSWVLLCVVLWSCSGTKGGVVDASKKDNATEADSRPYQLRLSEYLSMVPGVWVHQNGPDTKVLLHQDTANTANLPLFVLDSTVVGTTYATIDSMVQLHDVDKVTVLKATSATALFGSEAAHGAILIKTKKSAALKPDEQ